MLKIIIGIFIFCIILFFYLHIQFHYKTSNDLEIYEVEQASKDKIEEICDLRQPVIIKCDETEDKIINTTNKQFLLENYPVFDVKIRNKSDELSEQNLYVPLPLHIANNLFKEDNKSSYFSEGNIDFLQETGAIKNMSYNDEYLRPSLVSNCYYDVLFASKNLETPFRFDLNYRNYYLVTQGSIQVKLSPPKSSKYLYTINDYENFEFSSPVNPWDPQSKYKADFNKIKCLDITLYPGKILYIPAYWWYSFKFDENTSVSCFKYRTYLNNIAISPKIGLYILQNQNIERKIANQINIKELQIEHDSSVINIKSDLDIHNNKLQNECLDDKNIQEESQLQTNNLITETLINNEHL
jgi:hypothetical protein